MSGTNAVTLRASVTDGADIIAESSLVVPDVTDGAESALVQSLRKVQASINASLTSYIEQKRQAGDAKRFASDADSVDEEEDDDSESEEDVDGSVPKRLKC